MWHWLRDGPLWHSKKQHIWSCFVFQLLWMIEFIVSHISIFKIRFIHMVEKGHWFLRSETSWKHKPTWSLETTLAIRMLNCAYFIPKVVATSHQFLTFLGHFWAAENQAFQLIQHVRRNSSNESNWYGGAILLEGEHTSENGGPA